MWFEFIDKKRKRNITGEFGIIFEAVFKETLSQDDTLQRAVCDKCRYQIEKTWLQSKRTEELSTANVSTKRKHPMSPLTSSAGDEQTAPVVVSRTLIICMRGYVSGTLDIGMRGPRPRRYYSSLELVSSFVRYRLPGLLKLLLCYESCHRLISSCLTGVVAASSNLRQEIVAKHTGQLLIPNAVTSIRRTFFVVQARFSYKPNTRQ